MSATAAPAAEVPADVGRPLAGRDDTPETTIARDMALRAARWAVVPIAVCGAGWGIAGGVSAAFAVVIVAVNFLFSAWLITTTARIGYGALMAAVLGGYVLRLGLITLAVLPVKDAAWIELVPLGATLIVAHLGLLFWELRYVSASMAFPGLKPAAPSEKEIATR